MNTPITKNIIIHVPGDGFANDPDLTLTMYRRIEVSHCIP